MLSNFQNDKLEVRNYFADKAEQISMPKCKTTCRKVQIWKVKKAQRKLCSAVNKKSKRKFFPKIK